MPSKVTKIVSTLRSAWAEVNPLARGMSFSTIDFMEDRIYELEKEIDGLKQKLDEAQAELARQFPISAYQASRCSI